MNASIVIPTKSQHHLRSTIIKLVAIFIGTAVTFGVLLGVIYQVVIPTMMQTQIELRAASIARLFAATVTERFVLRDYIGVNTVTDSAAALPDVGYVALLNASGAVVAGTFGDITLFDTELGDSFAKSGFPLQIATKIRLNSKEQSNTMVLQVGGREVIDYALRLGDSNAEAHVGIILDGTMQNTKQTLIPYLAILFIMLIFEGLVSIWFWRTTVQSII